MTPEVHRWTIYRRLAMVADITRLPVADLMTWTEADIAAILAVEQAWREWCDQAGD